MRSRIIGNRAFLGCMAILCLVYVIVAIWLSRIGAFWSPDCGARFAVIRGWIEHGSLIHWPYAGASIDPAGQIHPLAFFLFHQAHGWRAIYAPLFPLMSGVMYRLIGFGGLLVIPVACGLGTAWILAVMARRLELRCHAFVPLLIGLGTPVLIYSVVFWDHVVMILLTAVAGYGMLRALQESQPRFAVLAGAALGFGIWIHELMAAMFLAALLAAIPLLFQRSGRRLVTGLIVGFVPLALLWMVGNKLIYGDFGGPHLMANMGGNIADHPFSRSKILSVPELVNRIVTGLLGAAIHGVTITSAQIELFSLFVLFGFLLFAYILATWSFENRCPPASILWLIAAGVALYLGIRIQWANGLFQATPLFIAALAIPWDAKRGSEGCFADGGRRTEDGAEGTRREARGAGSARTEDGGPGSGGENGLVGDSGPADASISPAALFYAWASRASWVYIIIVLLNPVPSGADWGARFLLPVTPLLTILALHAFEEQYNAAGPIWRRVVVACAIVVVVISIICQCEGLVLIQRNMRYNRDLINHALKAKTPVIVYTNIGTGPEMTAARLPELQFMVRSDDDLSLLLRVMRARHLNEFVCVADDMGLVPFERMEDGGPYRPDLNSPHTERLVEKGSQSIQPGPAHENGEPVQFVRFAIQRQDAATHSRETGSIRPQPSGTQAPVVLQAAVPGSHHRNPSVEARTRDNGLTTGIAAQCRSWGAGAPYLASWRRSRGTRTPPRGAEFRPRKYI